MTQDGDEFLDQITDAWEAGELDDEEYEQALEDYEESLAVGEGAEETAAEIEIEPEEEEGEEEEPEEEAEAAPGVEAQEEWIYANPAEFRTSIGKYFFMPEDAENYCAGANNPVLVWRYNEETDEFEVGTIYGPDEGGEEAAAA